MSLTEDEVQICNQALARLGSKSFTYAIQTSVEAVKSDLHYTQTRDALLRSHDWPFARARASLKLDTETPDFEWDYQFSLPRDYLRMRPFFRDSDNFQTDTSDKRFAIESDKVLCDDTEFTLKYIKKVTDPNEFDPLFTEVLILQLAMKLLHPVAGTEATSLKEGIERDLKVLMPSVRAVNRQESNTSGYSAWNMARHSSTGVTD